MKTYDYTDNSDEKCKIAAYGNYLYIVNPKTGKLQRFNVEIFEYDTIVGHIKFSYASQMVVHDGFLYVINDQQDLLKIDLKSLEAKTIGADW